jgi:CheY-like chemotaxis protein
MADATRILLIDDDRTVGKMVRVLLVSAGYVVHEAANGEIWLAAYRQHRIDLVITDIFMPEMEGLETINHLLCANPQVKIIAISEADDQYHSYLQSAVLLGATQSLKQPFTTAEMLTAAAAVLAA